MAKYRIVRGIHIEAGTIHKPGENDVFESASDLARLNFPESFRFEKLSENSSVLVSTPSASIEPSDDGLETMSETELRKFAEAEKIQLPKGARKDDVVKAIRAASLVTA